MGAALLLSAAFVISPSTASPASAGAGIAPGDQLSAGRGVSCAILDNQSVACWGDNEEGQLGRGIVGVPQGTGPVVGLSDAVAVSSGEDLACAALLDGSVWCWGDGEPTPAQVPGVVDARSVTVGDRHGCAVIGDGSVKCWGNNDRGQLGDGSPPTADNFTAETSGFDPATVAVGVSDAVQTDAAGDTTCAATSSGAVFCWGANTFLQTGSSSATDVRTPVAVLGLDDASQVSLGNAHSCAINTTGTVQCWGSNANDRLGTGSADPASIPTPQTVSGLTGVIDLAAGLEVTCALDVDGDRWCWGPNRKGEFGDGTLVGSATPSRVASPMPLIDIDAGHQTFCAQSTALTIACWGSNFTGSADGRDASTVATPRRLSSGAPGVFDVGIENLCVRTPGASAACRGGNFDNQLLDGTTSPSDSFVPAAGVTGVVDIALGSSFACAADATGAVRCWGSDRDGRLGDGPTDSTGTGLVDVVGLVDVSRIERDPDAPVHSTLVCSSAGVTTDRARSATAPRSTKTSP